MPFLRVPGVRSTVTYALLGAVIYAGLTGLPDNANIEALRKLMEYAIVFFFGQKAGELAARGTNT